VVNAIDDRLAKGDQIDPDWSMEAIMPLSWLFAAANTGGRAVVLAADHGHVLERGSEYRSADGGGSRWRPVGATGTGEGEVLLSGSRVLESEHQIVAAAVEGLRYKPKAAGYHGGATPQEVVAPLVVLAPTGLTVDGWAELAEPEPSWWLLTGTDGLPAEQPATAAPTPIEEHGQMPIFGSEPKPPPAADQYPGWIDDLFTSDAFVARREAAYRPPEPARIAALLTVLDVHGSASEAEVAQALGIASVRVATVVAAIGNLLNLEGFQVLARDRATGEVRMEKDLLRKQFGL
jgi:hypothetical protein